MTTKFPWSRQRKWLVRIRFDDKVIFVENQNRSESDLVFQVLDSICRKCDSVVLSQFVDPEIWAPGTITNLVDLIQEENTSEIRYLHLLNEAEIKAKYPLMQINIAGKLTRGTWQRLIHFGMNNLSNIIYGVSETVDNWDVEISRRNRIVIDWFNLKIRSDDLQFNKLVDESEFIGLTIDGNFFFCFSRVNKLNNLFKIIDGISKKNNYALKLSLLNISGKR